MPGHRPCNPPNPVILEWCEAHQFMLLTNNRKSMPGHLARHVAQDRHVPGILIVDPNTAIAAVAEDLALIAGASLENEFQDQIRYLPIAV
jgi:hypothetical protein